MTQWFNCEPITECASSDFAYCRKLDDGRVIFFNDDRAWFILTAEKAKFHFKVLGKVENSDDIEDTLQWTSCSAIKPSATSSGGSESDTTSTLSGCEEESLPGPTAES